jgi:hypothetical protein
MTLVTLYALLGDDIKMLTTEKSADNYFTIMTSLALVLFTFELIIQSIGKDDYLNTFFFWLDLVSTVSLITDIEPIWSRVLGDHQETNVEKAEQEDAAALARASRGARIGTKAGRIARVVRLIRLIRIVKLYKTASIYNEKSVKKKQYVHQSSQNSQDDALLAL